MILSILKEFILYTILVFAIWCMAQQNASPEYTVEALAFFVWFWITWRFKSFLKTILYESFAVYLILGAAWYIDLLLICLSMEFTFSEFIDLIMR